MDIIALLLTVGMIALPVVLIVAVFRARSRGATSAAGPIVRAALIVSAAWGAIALLRTVVITIFWFTPNVYPSFTLRTAPFWPAGEPLPIGDGVEPPPLIGDGFTTAYTSASGLSTSTRTLLAIGDAVNGCVVVVLAGLIAWTCFRLLMGAPFTSLLARGAVIAAGVCLVGGFASQILLQLGGSAAAADLIASGAAPAGLAPAVGVSMDFWPLWTALGLGAFAALIRSGATLQRETEGLV